jgi:hypothetical protein
MMPAATADLRVAPSTLGRGAGAGLFACRPFARGEWLTAMDGRVSAEDPGRRSVAERSHTRTLLHGVWHLDGLRGVPPPADAVGLGSYANDAAGPLRAGGPAAGRNNARACIRWPRGGGTVPVCALVATADIPAGAEILTPYGGGYWRARRSG